MARTRVTYSVHCWLKSTNSSHGMLIKNKKKEIQKENKVGRELVNHRRSRKKRHEKITLIINASSRPIIVIRIIISRKVERFSHFSVSLQMTVKWKFHRIPFPAS